MLTNAAHLEAFLPNESKGSEVDASIYHAAWTHLPSGPPRFLYHGVPDVAAASEIFRRGLVPGGLGPSHPLKGRSIDPIGVFLGVGDALCYACGHRGFLAFEGLRAEHMRASIVFEIDTWKLNLCRLTPHLKTVIIYLLAVTTRENNPCRGFDPVLRKRVDVGSVPLLEQRQAAGEWNAVTHPHLVARSLWFTGELVYRATVPPSAFSRCLLLPDGFSLPSELAHPTKDAAFNETKTTLLKDLFTKHGMSVGEAQLHLALRPASARIVSNGVLTTRRFSDPSQ